MVEPNAGSSAGVMPDADILRRLFEQPRTLGPVLADLGATRQDAMAVLADFLRSRLRSAGEPPDAPVLVTEFAAELRTPADYHCAVIAAELRRHGMTADVAAMEDLEADAAGVVHEGRRCALLYRMAAEEPDPVANYDLFEPLLAASRAGKVIIADELDDAIAGNKTILATVSEELDANRLPAALADGLRGFIPWTRAIEDVELAGRPEGLLGWVLANQEELVLKPGAGFCGRGVTLGCETPSLLWQDRLQEALLSPEAWLVQRLVRSHPATSSISRDGKIEQEQNFVDYGYFAVGDSIAHAIVRKNSPFGTTTRRVKLCGIGPVFFV